jgi:uncharacterized protein YndB with AHSA1/START domain
LRVCLRYDSATVQLHLIGDEMADDVTRQTTVPTTPDDAWRSLTEPEGLAGWLGEPLELDLRPGGELRLALADGEQRHGWVEAVEPERRLAFWWARDGEDATRVELELAPVEEGTLVTVTESRPLALLELRAAELAPRQGESHGGPLALAGV